MITSFSGYTGDNSGNRWLPGDLSAYKVGTGFTSYKGVRVQKKRPKQMFVLQNVSFITHFFFYWIIVLNFLILNTSLLTTGCVFSYKTCHQSSFITGFSSNFIIIGFVACLDVSILCPFVLDISFIFNIIFYWRCQLYYIVTGYVYDVKHWICLWIG